MISLLSLEPIGASLTLSLPPLPSLPALTLSYRRFCFLYLVFLNVLSVSTWELLWLDVDGDRFYHHAAYFSNWTLLIATLYFLAALRTPSSSSRTSRALLAASLPLSVLCCVVYWTTIFQWRRVCHESHGLVLLPLFKEINVHGVSAALLLFDLLSSPPPALRLPWTAAVWAVALGLLYHLGATLYVLVGGAWMYPFLDWAKPQQWLLLYATFIAMHAATMATQALRDRAYSSPHTAARAQ